jgi:hypothetical protein
VQLNLPVVLVGAGLPQLPGLTGQDVRDAAPLVQAKLDDNFFNLGDGG